MQLRQRPDNGRQSDTSVADRPPVKARATEDSHSLPQSNCLAGTRSKNLIIGDGTDSYVEVAVGVNLYMI